MTAQESATLTAATSTLIATRSSELNGRTATNAGTCRSSDQKVALAKAIPTGTARTIGVASANSSSRNVPAASSRAVHDAGAKTTRMDPATRAGNTRPEVRHSYQNCAAHGVANALC